MGKARQGQQGQGSERASVCTDECTAQCLTAPTTLSERTNRRKLLIQDAAHHDLIGIDF